jgi:hypothetical protein
VDAAAAMVPGAAQVAHLAGAARRGPLIMAWSGLPAVR